MLDWDCSVLDMHVLHMHMHAVCIHWYTNIGFLFSFGNVKLVTLKVDGIRNCFLCFGTPAQAPVIAFSLWRLLLYQNLASVTEQSNSQGSSYYMTYLVCYHSLESRGTTSRNGPPQSLVPLKFIATELN